MHIFGITKTRITNVSMLELMRQQQIDSSIAWKIHNSNIANIYALDICPKDELRSGVWGIIPCRIVF